MHLKDRKEYMLSCLGFGCCSLCVFGVHLISIYCYLLSEAGQTCLLLKCFRCSSSSIRVTNVAKVMLFSSETSSKKRCH